MLSGWFWSLLLVGATVLLSIAGTLLVRRLASVEVLQRHNDVAGFIYAVIGVVYAVLLASPRLPFGNDTIGRKLRSSRKQTISQTRTGTRKRSRVTFVRNSKVESATTSSWR